MKEQKKSPESPSATYWEYLHLDRLLSAQGGLDGDDRNLNPDQLHFIIVHQVFELWFKQIIRELTLVRDHMTAPKVDEADIPFIVHHLKRTNTILESAIKHFDLMETLTPQDFLVFRAQLGTASGFQSFQMRQIELILGLEVDERKRHGHGNPIAYLRKSAETSAWGEGILTDLDNAVAGPSLRQTLHNWLYRTPVQGCGPDEPGDGKMIEHFLRTYLDAMNNLNENQIRTLIHDGEDETIIRGRFAVTVAQAEDFLFAADIEPTQKEKVRRIRAAVLFIESYRHLPLLSWPRILLDTVVQLEEFFVIFRFRHARMVERVIGRRVGTGGSAGVDYLDQTAAYRIFKELWAVRTLLLPKEALPPLENSHLYGFSVENAGP